MKPTGEPDGHIILIRGNSKKNTKQTYLKMEWDLLLRRSQDFGLQGSWRTWMIKILHNLCGPMEECC